MKIIKNNLVKIILILALLACLVVVPHIFSRRMINLVIVVLVYIALGQSWNVLSGLAGLFSVTHAVFFGIGTFSLIISVTKFGMSLFSGILIGLLVNLALGLIVGIIGSKLAGLYLTMALIGIQQVVYTISVIATDYTGGLYGVSLSKDYLLPKNIQYYVALTIATGYMLLYVFIRRSRMGTNLVALKDNQNLAMALGSNVVSWRILATLSSTAMASLVGSFYALYMMSANPEIFSGTVSLKIMMVALVGGVGHVFGPVLGCFMIVIDEFVRGAMPSKYAPFTVIIYALVLIVVMFLKPDGLISIKLSKKRTQQASEKG
jgi:branched-chain amino acid transport system permease protein